MTPTPDDNEGAAGTRARLRGRRWPWLLGILAVWGAIAYLIAPRIWELYFHRHPDYAEVTRLTVTSDGHPGDPVNIALVGSETDLVRAMGAAGWFPADPITLRTSLRIAADSVLRRPDDDAPVSDLFLFGRRQDLAFEQPVGNNPRQRHHVRFWHWDQLDDGRPVWFGAATYDERVGLSYTTGQVTHHIGPDVDAERDRIAAGLAQAGCARQTRWIDAFHRAREGRNGGGDPWRTDGRLEIVELGPCAPAAKGEQGAG
jgi:hypothetical protein